MTTDRLDTPQRTLYGVHRPQRYAYRDPAPHIPFSYGPAYSPDTFPPMQTWEKVAWAFCVGAIGGFFLFCNVPW